MTTLYRTLALAIVIAAFALRLVAVETLPPGLYHDEAYYGLDAAGVLAGDLRLYFPANNGREPLFVYLAAAFVEILGRSPAAVRLASVFAGTAGAAAAFALAAGLYGRRVGLVTAALFAVAPWPVILGRVGFRAGLLPLVLALAVAATVRGARQSDRRWIAFGGALAGLSLYTYTAARLLPLAIAAWGLWWLWTRRARPAASGNAASGNAGFPPATPPNHSSLRVVMSSLDRDSTSAPPLHLALLWIASAFLVTVPLLLAFALDPAATLGRAGQVSILSPDINGGDLAGALARNLRGALGMVFIQGDFIPRHNVPYRPVLSLLGGALWLAGLGVMLWRRRAADVLVLIWIMVMLIPTLLAENAPHFLRAAGLLPALLVPPAIAVDAVAGLARRPGRAAVLARPIAAVLALALVAGELAATLAYARAAGAPGPARDTLAYAFESAAADLARELNTALGAGWRGGWTAGTATAPRAAGGIWLDRRLRDGWASVPFLVDTQRVELNDRYDPVFTTGPGVAFLQPEDLDLARVWADHRPGLRYTFRDGPAARGDLEAESRPLYVRIDGQPAPAVDPPIARFANGLTLLHAAEVLRQPFETAGLTNEPSDAAGLTNEASDAAARGLARDGGGERLVIETVWGVERPPEAEPTVFFQVLEGDRVVAASDAPLGRGIFPAAHWKPGDQVVERRVLDLPGGFDPARHRLIAGAYAWPSVERIPLVGGDGAAAGDHVEINVRAVPFQPAPSSILPPTRLPPTR